MSKCFEFPDDDFSSVRERMVRDQMEARGISSEKVLEVFRVIPRHLFCPLSQAFSAYGDFPLPIGSGQTISQPYIAAYMTSALEIKPTDRVLEIGTGSGYQMAVLACLAKAVFSIERIPELGLRARSTLDNLHFDNIKIRNGDGTLGWVEHSPYDAILVTAGAPAVPQPLLDQLALGGRLVAPIGDITYQQLVKWRRKESGLERTDLIPVIFVPLIGEFGWQQK
jgi:protein-L-isoaspartate(D-aspartate) O-methyltransferase